jgi:hypothetical protein
VGRPKVINLTVGNGSLTQRRIARRGAGIPPRLFEPEVPVPIPRRYSGRSDVIFSRVTGDGMSPTLLDNDVLVVVTSLAPRPHDLVLIPFDRTDALPGVTMSVARYNLVEGATFFTKDHPSFAGHKQDADEREILGVGVEILPRTFRSRSENHFLEQKARATMRSLRHPSEFAWFGARTLKKLTCALEVPASELVDGRLPCGYFRGFANAPQPHLGIGVRDRLTINPTLELRVGDLVIRTNDEGESAFGVLRRDGRIGPHASPTRSAFADTNLDVLFRAEGWHHAATIERVDSADHIALAAGRTETNRRTQGGGREELL